MSKDRAEGAEDLERLRLVYTTCAGPLDMTRARGGDALDGGKSTHQRARLSLGHYMVEAEQPVEPGTFELA